MRREKDVVRVKHKRPEEGERPEEEEEVLGYGSVGEFVSGHRWLSRRW